MLIPNRLRKIFLYFISKGTADGLLALRGIILANLLGPEAFGGWVLFRLCTNYCGFAQFGVLNGLEFHVARANNHKSSPSGLVYWRSALGFVLIVFGVIALVSVVLSFFTLDRNVAIGMRWFSLAILTEQVWILGLSYVRATGNLKRFAVYEATNAALQLLLALCLARIWGLPGAFAGFVSASALSLVLLSRLLSKIPLISKSHLSAMLKVGLPIFFSLLLGFSLASVDRLIVAGMGDLTLLGLYGFAFSVAGIAGSIALAIRVVIYPEVYASVANGDGAEALNAYLDTTILPFARIFPIIISLGALVIGPAISMLLPQYTEAIPAARILIFVGVTAGLERLGTLGVVAAQKQNFLPLLSFISLAINIALSIFMLWCGFGLQGVAAAAIFSRVAFSLMTLRLLQNLIRIAHPVLHLVQFFFPLGWCLISVILFENLFSFSLTLDSLLPAGGFLLVLTPILPGAIKDFVKIFKNPKE